MGDVVEMKRKTTAQVVRFGHTFKVEYQAGRTPELSDPAAALYLDGTLLAWLTVGFSDNAWGAVVLDIDEDVHLIDPPMIGMSPTTDNELDLIFLLDTEAYLLTTLTIALGSTLAASLAPPEARSPDVSPPDHKHYHPRERGRRAHAAWHDHDRVDDLLPDLIAVEVYDAIESMGMALADVVEEHIEEGGDRRECGQIIRSSVELAIETWKGGEE